MLYGIIGVLILILLAGLVFIFVMSNSRSVTDENENTIEDSAASEMISKNTETGPAMNKQETEENIPIESETTFVAPAPPATEPPVTESPAV